MTRLEASLLALCGLVAVVYGVLLLGGAPWAFIVAGLLAVASAFLVVDPKAGPRIKRRPKRTRQGGFAHDASAHVGPVPLRKLSDG